MAATEQQTEAIGCPMAASTSDPLPHGGTPKPIDTVIDLIAGSLGGTATVLVGQPLDTIKVKMQTFPELYKGATDCCVQTWKKEGIRGLYAGTMPSLVANVAENSVLFAAYGVCQKLVQFGVRKEKISQLNALENAFSGFLAAFFSGLALCPTELIKCRMQAMRELASINGLEKPKIGPWGLTKQILREDGVPGLFRGLTATLMREMPGYFFFFGGYEVTRELFRKPGQTKEEIGLVPTIISGGVGGVCLWTLIFPADVVKSRIQVNASRETFRAVTMKIVRTEGVAALYNGLFPTLIRTFPSTGALFVAYEYSRRYLHTLVD